MVYYTLAREWCVFVRLAQQACVSHVCCVNETHAHMCARNRYLYIARTCFRLGDKQACAHTPRTAKRPNRDAYRRDDDDDEATTTRHND